MSVAGSKRWWKAAAVAVLGGGTVAGGWVGLSRNAAAEPAAPVETALPAELVPQPIPRPELAPPPPGDVIPAAGTFPALPTLPVPAGIAPALPTIPPPTTDPAPSIPRPLDLGALTDGGQPPSIPALPPVDLPGFAPVPKPVEVKPVVPVSPPVDAKPVDPNPAPPKSATPKSAVAPLVAPVVPVLPPPSVLTPAPVNVAPPPSPAKSPARESWVIAPKLDSALQGGNAGNSVKIETPGAPSPVAPPMVPAIPAVGTPGATSGTAVDRPKPVVPPLGDPDKFVFPGPVSRTPTAPTPGDTNVLKLNQTAAAAVLGGALLANAGSPAPAANFPTVPLPTRIDEKADAAALKRDVEEANRKLADIQKDLKQITELLNGRKDSTGFPIPSDPGVVAELKTLKDKLAAVEIELNKVKTSSSLRPNVPANPIVDQKTGKGLVRVVNEYPIQISMVVNGTSYRIAPSKTLDIEVAAGDFNYQLLESGGGPTRSAIKEKETVTLRIK